MVKEIKKIKETFMNETIKDVWDYYLKLLTDDKLECWDWVILTASNEEQSKIYQKEIDFRLKLKKIPNNIRYLIVSDPDGKRIGSGGATLNVLKKLKEKDSRNFSELKILIIHSGGDSKRVPQYSCCGKLFSPVQRELPDGRGSTLFDELFIIFSNIPNRMSPGVLILSGDVLLIFNPLQIDLFYLDSAAISIKEDVSNGCNHGVFLSDENNILKEFLHKQNINVLKSKGAVNFMGNVDIDTGAIYLSSIIVDDLYSLLKNEKEYINDKVRLNLYGDFLYPLSNNVFIEDYYNQKSEGSNIKKIKKVRKELWETLSKYKMKIIKTSPSMFIHFGTTSELVDLVTDKIKKYSFLCWNNKVLTNVIKDVNYSINSSFIEDYSSIGVNSYIEKSFVGKNCNIGKNVILSNVSISNINIPDNFCFNTLKLKNGKYVTRVYLPIDNPKDIYNNLTKFLGNNIKKVLEFYGISESNLWDNIDKSMWEAKLYCEENTNLDSMNSSLKLIEIFNLETTKNETLNYFKKSRTSLKDSFNNCDALYIKKQEEKIQIKIRNKRCIDIAKEKDDINKIIAILLESTNLKIQIKKLLEELHEYPAHIKYRIYLALNDIFKNKFDSDYGFNYFEDECYKEIKDSTIINARNIIINNNVKEKSIVSLPIRINFAGGWSDTPPYCFENGGTVLNGAFKLEGKNPIEVTMEKINKKSIIISSEDLGVEKEFNNIKELKDCSNTNDLFSLPKASLLVSGVITESDKSMNDVYNRIGTGIKFTTKVCGIPKGSGLGTSSILAAACLKSIYEFLNIEVSYEFISEKVLEQEQLMGTGGGWQDQIGGLVPGIKLISTTAGYNQQFNIKPIKLSKEMIDIFEKRYVLIFTGQRRLAKNLLRNIMSGYIRGDMLIVNTINKIKGIAINMANAMEESNIESFAKLLNEHWELSKQLDVGCSNLCIDQILLSCEDLIESKMICGAGGGGFLQVLLKEGINKSDLNKRINHVFQDNSIKCYNISLVEEEL